MIAFGPPTIGSGLDPQLWLVNADGTNQRPIATLGEWTDWSPDSSRLVWTDSVFTTDNTGESARIWVADVATGEVTQLAPRGTVTWWLPDGEHIAYTPAENPEAGISVIPVAGGEPRHLTTGVGPFWSPDGTAFLVERDTAIHILSADASTDRVLLDRGGSPAWSPDGTRVAFVDVDDVGTFIVGVTDLDGNVQWSEVPGTDPEWSPHGSTSWMPRPARSSGRSRVASPTGDQADAGSGRSLSRRSSCALSATTMVDTLIARAPTLMGRTTPMGASSPAATGMASAL
jgi:dipeptidyl aminopeptidase/acylaminoacyl peptidase